MPKKVAQSLPSLESHGEGSHKKEKAHWSEKSLEAFIRVCIKEVEVGNRPNTHFTRLGWRNVVANFNESTGKNYNYKQLKNKWDGLKKEWQLWVKLVGKDTELGWDSQKRIVQASDEWWDQKLLEIPESIKFKERGLLFAEEMSVLFKNVVTTGGRACVPPSKILLDDSLREEGRSGGQIGSEGLENTEVEGDNDFGVIDTKRWERADNITLDEVPSSVVGDSDGSHNREKTKRQKQVVDKEKNKVSTVVQITRTLGQIAEAVELRTSQSTSVGSVMSIVRGLPGMEVGSDLWWQASDLLLNKTYREMFIAMEEPELQLEWLKRKTNQPRD